MDPDVLVGKHMLFHHDVNIVCNVMKAQTRVAKTVELKWIAANATSAE